MAGALLVEPANILIPTEKNTSQYHTHDPVRMSLGIGQGQR